MYLFPLKMIWKMDSKKDKCNICYLFFTSCPTALFLLNFTISFKSWDMAL